MISKLTAHVPKYLNVGVNKGITHILDNSARTVILELEDRLDHRQLGRGCVQTSECAPVVDQQSSANHIRTTVDSTSDQGNLEQ